MPAIQNSRTADRHVAVVGTGVVGLSAALGCAQRGIAVTLLGPVPGSVSSAASAVVKPGGDAPWDARIYALAPATVGLLERQRVWAQLDATRLCPVDRMEILGDDGGRLAFDVPVTAAGHLATICEESQLVRALWLACAMTPGIEHRARGFDSAVFPGDAGPGPAVKLRLDDGSELGADLVLGADGRQSAVRAAAGIVSRHSQYGQTAIVANFATQWPHSGIARQWFTDEGVVALLPLPGKRVSLVWSAPDALVPALVDLPPDAFARRVAGRARHSLGAMDMLGERHAFVLHRMVVDRLVRPGALLLGDAAHVVHPLAGQGLNLGLQDVAQFLAMLDSNEPWRRLGDVRALRRYERARAEPLALMRATVDGLARLFQAPDDRLRFLRNAGMSAVNTMRPLKNALVRHAMG